MNGPEFSRTDLTELQRQLVAWRQRQHGRARLPEEVWIAAAALAPREGVSQVARTLRLDYYKLRRRCAPTPGITPRTVGLPGFVELHVEDALQGNCGAFQVELAGPHGSSMTIGLGRDVSAVVALAEAFWRRIP
jgi:hypothetical protein